MVLRNVVNGHALRSQFACHTRKVRIVRIAVSRVVTLPANNSEQWRCITCRPTTVNSGGASRARTHIRVHRHSRRRIRYGNVALTRIVTQMLVVCCSHSSLLPHVHSLVQKISLTTNKAMEICTENKNQVREEFIFSELSKILHKTMISPGFEVFASSLVLDNLI